MINSTIITGQWEGYFEYGSTYRNHGKRVKFRLKLKDIGEGKFQGECIELEGPGYNPYIASISGFIEASFISFTKEYPVHFQTDELGNRLEQRSAKPALVTYEGNFDWALKMYSGIWEIYRDNERNKNGSMIRIGFGSWKMSKVQQSLWLW